ncbi:MAG: sugar kinase [Gammaproteobacteria bacterium]
MKALALQQSSVRRAAYEKVVIVTRKTELEELTARFNSVPQARFYLEHAGQDFMPIASAHASYQAVLDKVRSLVPRGLRQQVIERAYLAQYMFGEADLVVTIGPDGLVVNTAKYLDGQPILPLNPDPANIDGVLLPFTADNFADGFAHSLRQALPIKAVTMAEAKLNDGQTLLGFNDLFIGARTHVSARYDIAHQGRSEYQSSSGIIVSTGAGSTGWMRSVFTGASGIVKKLGGTIKAPVNQGRLPWDTDRLLYSVREPFPSKITGTKLVFGVITKDKPLTLTSHMADNGVIFSDGIESDFVKFNAGSTASISLSSRQARILVRQSM